MFRNYVVLAILVDMIYSLKSRMSSHTLVSDSSVIILLVSRSGSCGVRDPLVTLCLISQLVPRNWQATETAASTHTRKST